MKEDYGLEQKLSNITLGSKGASRSLDLEGIGKITKDSSGWTKLEPEVNSTDEDEASTYSLKSEAGNFECSVSGLRWVCQDKVSFKYQFCSSEEPMKRMEMMRYMPAGPLIDITVISGKLSEVYLPHWICIDDIPKILQKFAVLHIDDCGDVVEKVSEVTSSHVKLCEPVFSPRVALMKMGFPVKIHCNVLIYSKAYASCTVLHVYLTPLDPALKETIDKDNKEYKFIRKPRPNEGLKMQQDFNLTADITAEICPEKITLSNSSQSQSSIFFDVHFENPISDFNLTLSQLNKGKGKTCWSHKILKEESTGGPSSENESRDTAGPSAGETAQYTTVDGEHFVDKHRTELINRKDSSGWTKLEPEVNSTDEDEASTYSLKSEAGNFECSVSGLRWVCQDKVSFKYQFCSSEEPMKRMEMMRYMPAGPLIDITVISGKLSEVYLPHWICIDDIPKILQKFAVLHIDDCGDVVEKVSEVTSSHVKLCEPVFSPRVAPDENGLSSKNTL
ncbi:hypothetical protein CgunFtcFv8_019332 [Champsocephalus gunnari]|uniref:FIIND domain-containing protein n=1 Tax=Champsocephalus gunnari TaxID=52237 RepID=A0AAN8HN41_CHAGU|nr:hypothetical protein CgunFtcFv8_019332 [Champsocephalus gunnari]